MKDCVAINCSRSSCGIKQAEKVKSFFGYNNWKTKPQHESWLLYLSMFPPAETILSVPLPGQQDLNELLWSGGILGHAQYGWQSIWQDQQYSPPQLYQPWGLLLEGLTLLGWRSEQGLLPLLLSSVILHHIPNAGTLSISLHFRSTHLFVKYFLIPEASTTLDFLHYHKY